MQRNRALSTHSFHAARPPLFNRQKKRNRRRDKGRHVAYPGSIAEKKPPPVKKKNG